MIPLLVLEGRAWDTGLENLWVHVDSEGAIDWVGVVDPTLRALPDDPYFGTAPGCGGALPSRDRIVALPSEAALTTWVAHRSHRALEPLFDKLFDVSGGAMSVAAMWHVVGAAVVERRHPGAAAGRVERADEHAPRTGRARRAGRIRCARARLEQNSAAGKALLN